MSNKEIIIFELLDSTNNYAMQKVHAGMAAHGDTFLALQQTAGKGQHGKIWLAEKGKSILMSKVLNLNASTSPNFQVDLGKQFQLSALVAVAVREWFANKAGDNVFIKWPNDIYYSDRKAGGILIENVVGRKILDDNGPMAEKKNNDPLTAIWKWAIVGVGININQSDFPDSLTNPVSLKQVTGKEYDVIELANDLNIFLEKYWKIWITGGWMDIYTNYNQHLYKRGQQARLRKGNVVMPCTIKSVSENGKLLIEEDDNVSFTVGEVAWEK